MLPYDPAKRIPGFEAILAGPEGDEMRAVLRGQMAYLDREVEPDAPVWVLTWTHGLHPNTAEKEWALVRTHMGGDLRYSLRLDREAVAEATSWADGRVTAGAYEPEHLDELLSLLYNLEASIPQGISRRSRTVELHYDAGAE